MPGREIPCAMGGFNTGSMRCGPPSTTEVRVPMHAFAERRLAVGRFASAEVVDAEFALAV